MTQNSTTSQRKSLIGCLGRRILSISFLLLVIPLMVHAILIYREARKQAILDNLNNLSLLSRSEALYVQQIISENFIDLKTMELIADFKDKKFENGSNFSEIAFLKSFTSFFLAEKDSGGKWTVLAAAMPERLSQNDLNPKEYEKIFSLGTSAYLFQDPAVDKKELRMGYSIGNNRIIVSGIPLASISSMLIKAPTIKTTPIAAFSKTGNDLYYASSSIFEMEQCRIFEQEELVDVASQPFRNFHLSKKGGFIGVKIPIATNSFYLIIALTKEQFFDIASQNAFNHLLQLTVLFAFIGGGGVLYLTSRIARPLKQLLTCLDQVGAGDLKVRYQNDPVGFELNILGQEFNQMLTNLEVSIAETKTQKMAKELLKHELNIGQDIQKSILKTSLHEAGDFEFSYAFMPAMEISGDFYDVYKISDTAVIIALADTSGKGISACLYSLGARSMIRALAKSGCSLEKMLCDVNQLFLEDAEHQGMFMTAFIGILDLSSSTLQYASCGHPPAYHMTKASLQPLDADGMALGADKSFVAKIHTVTINGGDKLIVYTDGIIETQNTKGEMYGFDRLKAFLDGKKEKTASTIVKDLQKEIEGFSMQKQTHDDITILCFEKKG